MWPNAKVIEQSQPLPMIDLSLSKPAESGSLHRLAVSSCPEMADQKAARNHEDDKEQAHTRRSLCGQVELLTAPVKQTTPLQIPTRRVRSDAVALDAAE